MKQINIKEYFKQEVEKLRADRSVVPSLMIINATTQDPANQIYIRRNKAGTILGDFIEIDEIAERNNVWSTPVPGGVGLLTRLGLMKNCLQLAKQAQR